LKREELETGENMRTPEARISGTAGESVQAISAYFTLFPLISAKIFIFCEEVRVQPDANTIANSDDSAYHHPFP
jgi:hypothetical protein